ncbi:MAG TPA: hypothetical protein DD640_09345 [Clostridiales bacterium]|nr:hypothetical protein [Clostridiales bacterium]
MAKQPTLHDVARSSGVSIATVSRVLANSGYPVSEDSRRRVLKAARALRYTPNAIGKNLKKQDSREIGVLLPNLTNPYYAQLLQAIHDTADRFAYSIVLCSAGRDARKEMQELEMLISKRVSGLLLASINPDMTAAMRAIDMGYPLVTIEQSTSLACMHVGFDFRRAGAMLVEHLASCGHTRIGFLGAPLDRPSRVQMLQGFRDGMQQAGLDLQEEAILLSESESEGAEVYEIENGRRCAARLLRLSSRPTACVCLNDMTAFGAMGFLQQEGLHIPGDISLVGCDNVPYSVLSSPPLTTIDQHAYQMGTLAVERLIGCIAKSDLSPCSVMLTPELIVRGSSCRPKESPCISVH